jgi:hypothetical protein
MLGSFSLKRGFSWGGTCCAEVAAWMEAAAAGGAALAAARARMVREQITARWITDSRLLAAMARVPRHEFVPASQPVRPNRCPRPSWIS